MAAPVNTVAPSFTGTLRTLTTQTGVEGTWTGSPTLAHQWQRAEPVRHFGELVEDEGEVVTEAWESIAGATDLNYTAQPTETGKMLRRQETATNGDGSTIAYTAQRGPLETYIQTPFGIGAIRGALLPRSNDED